VDLQPQLLRLVEFLERLAARLPVVVPAHPRTQKQLAAFGLDGRARGIPGMQLTDPISYRENLGLMAAAKLVITDSGGMQEETTYLGVPCLTFRDNTERPVTVTTGTNTLIRNDLQLAEALVEEILDRRYKPGAPVPLWDGHASERILDALRQRW
jgi:UDP-N-acetylglucosamine 2-epimerase (non-hydrolysing)